MPDTILEREISARLVLASLPIAVVVVDTELTIIEFNEAASRLTGWSRSEALGKKCPEIVRSTLGPSACALRKENGAPAMLQEYESTIISKSGLKIPVAITVSPLTDHTGAVIASLELLRDATESKRLEARKKDLISLFAHDLKTPVTISAGFIERLLQGKAGALNDKQLDYLEIIKKEMNRLACYIHSFLTFSKIETGQFELQLEYKAIDDILIEAIKAFRVQAHEKKINIDAEIPQSLPTVLIDALQFTRVISNLLDNAIKFSDIGTSIHMLVAEATDEVIVEIQDQGPGIAPHEQEHIFESFYRVPGKSRTTRGNGLGLATVKAIIEAHGGRVLVRSEVGKGSCFTILIPKNCRKNTP